MSARKPKPSPSPKLQPDGGALGRDSIYVTRAADMELQQALSSGEYCHVFAPRQAGKTSLCQKAKAILEEQGMTCIFLDMSVVNTAPELTREGWYREFFRSIYEQALPSSSTEPLGDKYDSSQPGYLFEQMARMLRSIPDKRVILCLDEIDELLSARMQKIGDSDGFFLTLRAMFNARNTHPEFERLTICLFGVTAPYDLIKDSNRSRYNIGKSIFLEDFSEQEVLQFKAVFEDRHSDSSGTVEQLLKTIHQWTSGHPKMTQTLCALCLQAWPLLCGAGTLESEVAKFAITFYLPETARPLEDFIEPSRLNDSPNRLDLLLLYKQLWDKESVDIIDHDKLQRELRLCGLAALRPRPNSRRILEIRNEIVRRRCNKHWIDQQLRDVALATEFGRRLLRWISQERAETLLLNTNELERYCRWLNDNRNVQDLVLYQYLVQSCAYITRTLRQELDAKRGEQDALHRSLEELQATSQATRAELSGKLDEMAKSLRHERTNNVALQDALQHETRARGGATQALDEARDRLERERDELQRLQEEVTRINAEVSLLQTMLQAERQLKAAADAGLEEARRALEHERGQYNLEKQKRGEIDKQLSSQRTQLEVTQEQFDRERAFAQIRDHDLQNRIGAARRRQNASRLLLLSLGVTMSVAISCLFLISYQQHISSRLDKELAHRDATDAQERYRVLSSEKKKAEETLLKSRQEKNACDEQLTNQRQFSDGLMDKLASNANSCSLVLNQHPARKVDVCQALANKDRRSMNQIERLACFITEQTRPDPPAAFIDGTILALLQKDAASRTVEVERSLKALGPISYAFFLGNGLALAEITVDTKSGGSRLALWDVDNWQSRSNCTAAVDRVLTARAGQNTVLIVSENGSLQIYNKNCIREKALFGEIGRKISWIDISADEKQAVIIREIVNSRQYRGEIRALDELDRPKHFLQSDVNPQCSSPRVATFSADGRQILTSADSGYVCVFDSSNGKYLWGAMVSSYRLKSVATLSLAKRQLIVTLDEAAHPALLNLGPRGDFTSLPLGLPSAVTGLGDVRAPYVALLTGVEVKLWDLQKAREYLAVPGTNHATSATVSRNGRWLLLTRDKELTLRSLERWRYLRRACALLPPLPSPNGRSDELLFTAAKARCHQAVLLAP